MKQPEQRVGVFFDVANMYYSARSEYNARLNFGKVLETAVAGRKLVRAIAYAVKTETPEEQAFFEALNKMGIEVYTKELQTFYDGSKKGDIDMELAIDTLKMASKLDTIVLVSGDGDYRILLEHLKALGCRVEVIGFGKSVSSRLLDVTHDFINLEDNATKFIIPLKDKNGKKTKRSTARSSSTRTQTKRDMSSKELASLAELENWQN